jgi:ABC-type branched-subunit amino acid transport system substrate-binding protein
VVKIGVIAPIDAGLTSFGRGIRNSVELAVNEANARSAIPGWRIEVDAQNDSSDPATGEHAAQTLAADPAVIGVVGTYNSGVAATAAPVLTQHGIAMISPSNTDPTLTHGADRAHPTRPHRTYFRMVATDAEQGPFLARYAREHLHANRVAIVSETKSVSRGLANDFSRSFTNAGGTVVYDKTVPDNTTDFGAEVSAITPLHPDLLFFGGEYKIAAALRSAAASVAAPLMGGDGIQGRRLHPRGRCSCQRRHRQHGGCSARDLEIRGDIPREVQRRALRRPADRLRAVRVRRREPAHRGGGDRAGAPDDAARQHPSNGRARRADRQRPRCRRPDRIRQVR